MTRWWGGALLVAAWGAFWWLALPRHEICALTFPAPAGCGSGRVPVAVAWSVVTGCFYAAMLYAATRVPRRRWEIVAVLGLILGVVWGFFSVLYA